MLIKLNPNSHSKIGSTCKHKKIFLKRIVCGYKNHHQTQFFSYKRKVRKSQKFLNLIYFQKNSDMISLPPLWQKAAWSCNFEYDKNMLGVSKNSLAWENRFYQVPQKNFEHIYMRNNLFRFVGEDC